VFDIKRKKNYKSIMRAKLKVKVTTNADPHPIDFDGDSDDTLGPKGQENDSDKPETRELAYKIAGQLFVDVRTVYKVLRGEHVRGMSGSRIRQALANMKAKG